MKVNLVVTAEGPNQGRAIPITVAKFIVGRDPDCQLRPASQAISKKHCAFHIRGGVVSVEDFGSMNGTHVNGEPVTGERELKNGDAVKVGPLEFRIDIQLVSKPSDSTPLPDALRPLPGSQSALKKLQDAAGKKPSGGTAPAPKPVHTPTGATPVPVPKLNRSTAGDADSEADSAAAMLLSMDDDSSGEPHVPEGSTIMEGLALDASGNPKPVPKKEKEVHTDSSSTAGDLLKKYFRRTGG